MPRKNRKNSSKKHCHHNSRINKAQKENLKYMKDDIERVASDVNQITMISIHSEEFKKAVSSGKLKNSCQQKQLVQQLLAYESLYGELILLKHRLKYLQKNIYKADNKIAPKKFQSIYESYCSILAGIEIIKSGINKELPLAHEFVLAITGNNPESEGRHMIIEQDMRDIMSQIQQPNAHVNLESQQNDIQPAYVGHVVGTARGFNGNDAEIPPEQIQEGAYAQQNDIQPAYVGHVVDTARGLNGNDAEIPPEQIQEGAYHQDDTQHPSPAPTTDPTISQTREENSLAEELTTLGLLTGSHGSVPTIGL